MQTMWYIIVGPVNATPFGIAMCWQAGTVPRVCAYTPCRLCGLSISVITPGATRATYLDVSRKQALCRFVCMIRMYCVNLWSGQVSAGVFGHCSTPAWVCPLDMAFFVMCRPRTPSLCVSRMMCSQQQLLSGLARLHTKWYPSVDAVVPLDTPVGLAFT